MANKARRRTTFLLRALRGDHGARPLNLKTPDAIHTFLLGASETDSEYAEKQSKRLASEYKAFNNLPKNERAEHRRSYVLIQCGTVVDYFPSMASAIEKGSSHPDRARFLVKHLD